MRYSDWDVILFPTDHTAEIPFKEFKVACHVVPDSELSHIHGTIGLPVMTCFVPSLAPGAGFQISIHSWRVPDISQFTCAYSQHTELVKFEARVLLDGCLVSSIVLDREVNGPHLITNTFGETEFTKTGEPRKLRFPPFPRELLSQNYWNPGDDIGRIKIIISEGFPRDSVSVPIERVKNIVAFSFQHAPLWMLEMSEIAWPNPSMWPTRLTRPVPMYHAEGAGSHAHSPRKKSWSRNIRNQRFPTPIMGSGGFPGNPAVQVPYYGWSNTGPGNMFPYHDPFSGSEAYTDWVASMTRENTAKYWPASLFRPRGQTNSDISMPDYVPSSGPESDSVQISEPGQGEDVTSLYVPKNAPAAGVEQGFLSTQGTEFQLLSDPTTLSPDFASSLTQSLLNQPVPLPDPPCHCSFPSKPRGGIRHATPTHSYMPFTEPTSCVDGIEGCKLSQPMFGLGGAGLAAPISASPEVSENQNKEPPTPQAVFSASSRSNSFGDYTSSNITDIIYGATEPSSQASIVCATTEPCSVSALSAMVSLGNTDRNRNAAATCTGAFTPASARTIDEEGQPRGATPH
ncbi:hypothetical protein MFIFM68171_07665 [Madurella fahalii]|uniref:Uncharacterized protein n=1 Tax=Madurella fahalii TaxID=1157608 RepID=A0ABQ0GID2_9PEZI